MRVIPRAEAMAAGLQRYFNGTPCRHGHMAERYVVNGHCVECQSAYSKGEVARRNQLRYRTANKKRQAKLYEAWMEKNRDKKLEYMKGYAKEVAAPRYKERYKTDMMLVAQTRLRARLHVALRQKKFPKNGRTQDIVGCDFEFLVVHIEAQFLPGMGWHNRELWHIDHIVPVASAETEEDLLALFHFTNLRPIWAKDNRSKSGKRVFLI